MDMQNMRSDEAAAFTLRRLYESRGFRRVRPGKFEEYTLYVENKNFLQSDQIITFMDMDGRLRALKPDVTLSIVKNIPTGKLPASQKLYYVDEVYRASRENREYRALSQIGVELVGPPDPFADIEVVDLALLSLGALGKDYVLDLSHIGFVSGLLDDLGLSHTASRRVLAAIHAKSAHEIAAILQQAGIPETAAERIDAMAGLHGDIRVALPKARALISGPAMQAAYDELAGVADALSYNGFAGHLNLDFSVVGELDYYNGILFNGYLKGIPQCVLSGGRYDNLMHRMGKASGAAGFAVSLDELGTHIRSGRPYDFDMLITYEKSCNAPALLRCVRQLTEAGLSVRLESAAANLAAAEYSWNRHACFEGDTLREEDASC